MTAYSALARHYDALMSHIDYAGFVDRLLPLLGGARSILDLGCGTGTLAAALAGRGCELVAADRSPDMLAEARSKSNDVLWLCQPMHELDLYGTVQAALCTLDGLNYLIRPDELTEALRRVCLFLEPAGRFYFDVHAPGRLAALDGRTLVSRAPGVFCVWEHRWSAPLCSYGLTLFERDGAHWRRLTERHRQREHPPDALTALLYRAGFSSVRRGGKDLPSIDGSPDRLVFLCEK